MRISITNAQGDRVCTLSFPCECSNLYWYQTSNQKHEGVGNKTFQQLKINNTRIMLQAATIFLALLYIVIWKVRN